MDFSIIKEIRKIKGLSQQKLGEKLGVSGAYIQQIENNKKNPSMKTLQRISEALNVDIDVLINGIPPKIYNRNDVFDLYNKLNPTIKLSKFLGFPNDFCMDYEMFISGQSGDLELYRKLAEFLNLSNEDLYNWYLSDLLCELFKWDDFGVSNLSHDDLKYIFDNNLLEKQAFDNLNTEGLSENNEKILKNYLDNRTMIKINKMRSKEGYKPFGRTKKLDDIKIIDSNAKLFEKLDTLALNENFIEKLDKVKLIYPILDSYGVKLSLSDDKKYITIDIPSKDIYKDIHLEDFLDFTDKIFWGIEREIDYLEHLYD